MCTNPLHIKNKTKTCTVGVTRDRLVVPCGKCDECRASKADEWFQRIYEEFIQCEKHGGKVIFVTFTYNDEHLPRFYYVDDEGNDRSFPCFSKFHKDKYLNSFRKYFERLMLSKGYTLDYSYPFKVIWCSEYGLDDRFTHRPHYHALFYIPKEWLDIVGSFEPAWKAILRKYWSDFPNNYGFVRFSPGNSIFVNSEFAGIYASKYIVKDVSFYHQPEVEEYLKDVTISKTDKKYLAVRDFLPRHWQSEKFGATLERIYSVKENFLNGYDFGIKSEVDRGKSLRRKCPMYIQKRMLYDYNELGQMKLNSLGKEFKRDKFMLDIQKSVRRYLSYLDVEDLKSKIDSIDIKESDKLARFDSHQDIIEYVTSILTREHNRHSDGNAFSLVEGLTDLSLFNRVWSGSWTYKRDDLVYIDSLSHQYFIDESLNRYIDNLYMDDIDLYHPDGIFTVFSPHDDGAFYFDACARFEGFADVLDIISECQNIYRIKSQKKYLEDRMRRKENKFLIKSA